MRDVLERLKSSPTNYGEEADLIDDATVEIARLRAQYEAMDKMLREANQHFMRVDMERNKLRAENETLRRDVKTAVMGDSAELQDVKRENEKLHREAAIRIDQITREQEAHLRTIADYNRSRVQSEKLRLALKPFADAVLKDEYSWKYDINSDDFRAAAAAIRESGE